ncbi:MAG: type II toxin-antitoxin system Phd/YefM family antitoxin, partial [Deltaproteobacteria bacterium]|nr:type II toxin-antitoxin system Phd/YefM family antitoxin [Deltaproteobacteria bacterium]
VITGKRNNAVLISAEDWASIQETMYLLSVPGMRESIMEGLQVPVGRSDGFRRVTDPFDRKNK